MNVAIIKYNAGNIRSVDYALRRLGVTPLITADKEMLSNTLYCFLTLWSVVWSDVWDSNVWECGPKCVS